MINIDTIFKHFIEKKHVKAIFSYGSVVYGNKEPDDFDFIVITDFNDSVYKFIDGVEVQCTFYTFDRFCLELNRHEISMIECMALNENDDKIIKYMDDDVKSLFKNFSLKKGLIRKAISKKSSNSYVKAKKKILIDKDFDLASSKKSLWHSLRMVIFATDYCKNNSLVFDMANELYHAIDCDYKRFNKMDNESFWQFLHSKYKPIHNKLLSDFRELAPKEDL